MQQVKWHSWQPVTGLKLSVHSSNSYLSRIQFVCPASEMMKDVQGQINSFGLFSGLYLMASSLFHFSFPAVSLLETPTKGLHSNLVAEDKVCLGSLTLDFSFLLHEPAEKSLFEIPTKGKLPTILTVKDKTYPSIFTFVLHMGTSEETSLNKINYYTQELC